MKCKCGGVLEYVTATLFEEYATVETYECHICTAYTLRYSSNFAEVVQLPQYIWTPSRRDKRDYISL